MASAPNLYPRTEETFPASLFGAPKRDSYRAAVKQVILDVKARSGFDSEQLGEKLGISKDTVENAENMVCSLEAVTLLKIAFHYGEEAINPVRSLYLCAPAEQPTIEDRLARIEGEAATIRRELAR
jgi:transcriptional regulator with XRE-family HTH domain